MTLKQKALKAAIEQISKAQTRDEANKTYTIWSVFHGEKTFFDAVMKKQSEFKSKKPSS